MQHQEDRPKYWNQWLRDRGVAEAVEQLTNQQYRALRGAHERMWTYAYAGTVAGALLGVLASLLYVRWATGRTLSWPSVALAFVGAALAGSAIWWLAYWSMHKSRRRSRGALASQYLDGQESYARRILETVADGLARSEFRPRDERLEVDELTQATIVTGLREAPTSELERNLLERLVGSAFVPTVDGSVFVFKLGPPCMRCEARTRTGPLRLLNVPAHWAAANGYQRLKELPSRGRRLLAAPLKALELKEFLDGSLESTGRSRVLPPNAELLLCENCGKEGMRRGLIKDQTERRA
jgi:hypothetical protein